MNLAQVFRVAVLGLALLTAACAITPSHVESGAMCKFESYALDVEDPPTGPVGVASGGKPTSLHDLIGTLGVGTLAPGNGSIATAAGSAPLRPRSDSILILSGGSENGAFGAGFLAAWHRNTPDGQLPAFKVVTGISTGAILATSAFVDNPQSAVDGYSILRESDLLALYVTVDGGKPTTLSSINVFRKGALGDLEPLRQRLHQYIPESMLEAVYHQSGLETATYNDDRRLLVGVVDIDTGRARALDLTQMAAQHHLALASGNTADARHRWDCYINAIVASSSAPLAARPVFIDNRMYVDGGARFGVFYSELKSGVVDEAKNASPSAPVQHVFVIINGTLQLSPICGKIDEAKYCPDGDPPTLEGFHKTWSFLPLALRSEKILSNQVYRFSVERVMHETNQDKLIFHSALITDDVGEFEYKNTAEALGPLITQSCIKWKEADRKVDNPIQFEARYMRCLISYGENKEETVYKWHSLPMH